MTRPRQRRQPTRRHGRGWLDLNQPDDDGVMESEIWFAATLWLRDHQLDDRNPISQYNHGGPQPAEAERVLVEYFGTLDEAKRAWESLGEDVQGRMPAVGAWLRRSEDHDD
jgi:hypothetical protein